MCSLSAVRRVNQFRPRLRVPSFSSSCLCGVSLAAGIPVLWFPSSGLLLCGSCAAAVLPKLEEFLFTAAPCAFRFPFRRLVPHGCSSEVLRSLLPSQLAAIERRQAAAPAPPARYISLNLFP